MRHRRCAGPLAFAQPGRTRQVHAQKLRGGLVLQRELVGVLVARKLHPETFDAHCQQFLGERRRRFFSRLVAVVCDVHTPSAVLLHRGSMIRREAIHAVAGRHVAIARAPERQRIDERFAQNDFFRRRQRLLIPHAAVRTGQVQMQRRARPQAFGDLAAVHLDHLAHAIKNRNHDGPIEVLVSRVAKDAQLLQSPAHVRSRLPVLRRQPQAQRAVGEPQPEVLDHLRRLQAALNQVGLRLGRPRERVVVVARDLHQELFVVGVAVDGRRQLAYRRLPHGRRSRRQ